MKHRPNRKSSIAKRISTYLALFAMPILAIAAAKSMAAKPAIVVQMLDTPPSFQPVRTMIKAGDHDRMEKFRRTTSSCYDRPFRGSQKS